MRAPLGWSPARGLQAARAGPTGPRVGALSRFRRVPVRLAAALIPTLLPTVLPTVLPTPTAPASAAASVAASATASVASVAALCGGADLLTRTPVSSVRP